MGAADDIALLAAQRDAGNLTQAEFEAERAKVLDYPPLLLLSPPPPPPAAARQGKAKRILTVIASIGVALVVLRVVDVVYLRATLDERWIEGSEQSCSTMLASVGGGSSSDEMTAVRVRSNDGTPSFKVTGGTHADRPVFCLNHVNWDGDTVSASRVFYKDTGEKVT